MTIEFLIPRRPLSSQAKRRNLQAWKDFVRQEAEKAWTGTLIEQGDLHLTLVYLCAETPPDTDNIIKPIQDALVGLIFSDDGLVSDVESHRRYLTENFDLTQLPELVIAGIVSGKECVYVKVTDSLALEAYL